MASVWGVLKRRNVVKVAMAYAIVAWLLVQVIVSVEAPLSLPDWTDTLVIVFLLIGFIVAVFLAWAYELTPEGVKQSKSIPLTDSVARVTGRKLDFAIIGLLVLAVGFMFVDNYVIHDDADVLAVAEVTPTDREQQILPNSIAVLPFENLSLDPDDAFFAAGIHEEILNQLVKLSSLNVIARTSMMRYADTDKGIPQIAEELNVETVMEGSVRYADARVLITVQLIDPATNAHLWSESYNREFSDIFAIQADVATNVAYSLEAQLSPAEQESIESEPTDSAVAYALYLRSLQRNIPRLERLEDLDEAISIDPSFGLAYGQRAYTRSETVRFNWSEADFVDLERAIRDDARRALSLDPAATMAYVAVARLDETLWRGGAARSQYEQALEIKPSDPDVLIHYASLLRNLGELEAAVAMARRVTQLDPASPVPHHQSGHIYMVLQDFDAAMDSYQIVRTIRPDNSGAPILMSFIATIRGEPEEARSYLQVAERITPPPAWAFQAPRIAVGYSLAGFPEEAERVFAQIEARNEETPLSDIVWAYAFLAVGDYEQSLARLNSAIDARRPEGFVLLTEFMVNMFGDPMLNTDPRFIEARARLQFTE